MLSQDQIKERLQVMQLRAVAKAVGIHENALIRFRKGHTALSARSHKLMSDYLEAFGKDKNQ